MHRYLVWSDAATERLIKLHCCHTLGQPMTWVDARLEQLAGLLPDLMRTGLVLCALAP